MDSQIRQELLTKSPVRLMFQLGIPGIVGMVVIGLYPFMDGVFAGNIIGQSAMAACSVAMHILLYRRILRNFLVSMVRRGAAIAS